MTTQSVTLNNTMPLKANLLFKMLEKLEQDFAYRRSTGI